MHSATWWSASPCGSWFAGQVGLGTLVVVSSWSLPSSVSLYKGLPHLSHISNCRGRKKKEEEKHKRKKGKIAHILYGTKKNTYIKARKKENGGGEIKITESERNKEK